MEKKNSVLIVDFGGQNALLSARRIRDLGVYCEITPQNKAIQKMESFMPAALVFVGGSSPAITDVSAEAGRKLLESGLPVLGIEYGMQLIAALLGGQVEGEKAGEYAKADVKFDAASQLFKGVPQSGLCWMQSDIFVKDVPQGFVASACAEGCTVAAMENAEKKIYGTQFHLQNGHTENGLHMMENFLFGICGLKKDWSMTDYSEKAIADLRAQIGDGKVLLALSGGVDSSVCAAMLSKAVGKQLTCVFVDHGLMRKNEGDEVEQAMKVFDSTFIRVDAEDRFLGKLKGVTDPEKKRKIVGEEFIRVFEEEAKKIGVVDFLAQGTIYPDIVESGVGVDAKVVKSHHNVGGLPEHVDFKEIVEPLRDLFKDEVRALGLVLGLPEAIVRRQPFPGPGLSVRCIGEVTKERLDILRDADAIFREEIAAAGLDSVINQYFAVLTNIQTVGVTGDSRTYDYTLALRAVETADFMTAKWVRVPYDLLDKVSGRIVREVGNINRICYDITSKPPATIEWE